MDNYTMAEMIAITEDDITNLETFKDCIELID